VLRASVFDTTPESLVEEAGRPFDVVLSDMAPHTSGNRFVDQQRSLRLLERAMELARVVSRPGAAFVGKVFHGEDLEATRDQARVWYGRVKLTRPKATRKQSYEVYMVCLDLKDVEPTSATEP
jgi:23S rRNA (uridine2552-2'-O)-methyltransferase